MGFFLLVGCLLFVLMVFEVWLLIFDVVMLIKVVNKEFLGDVDFFVLLEELKKVDKNIENIEDIFSFLCGMLVVVKGGVVRGLVEDNLI